MTKTNKIKFKALGAPQTAFCGFCLVAVVKTVPSGLILQINGLVGGVGNAIYDLGLHV